MAAIYIHTCTCGLTMSARQRKAHQKDCIAFQRHSALESIRLSLVVLEGLERKEIDFIKAMCSSRRSTS